MPSVRAITRLTGASKNTVVKLLIASGKACAAYHDAHVRDVKASRCQADEIWAFTHCKQKNVAAAKGSSRRRWRYVDVDRNRCRLQAHGRDGEYATAFIDDLHARLANRVQLTSDGHRAYLEAVEAAFGADVDYAQLVKLYGASPDSAKGPV